MKKRNIGLLAFWMVVGGCFLIGSAMACSASYVKSTADRARSTHLHDKATRVADQYLEQKGVDPTSSHADIIRPYVVGTSLVDHQSAAAHEQRLKQARLNADRFARSDGRFTYREGRGRARDFTARVVRPLNAHSLDKPLDECVRDSNECKHHSSHFGDVKRRADLRFGVQVPATQNLGG